LFILAVLSRYPLEDIPGLPLPEKVAMFCLPLGATIEGWPAGAKRPSPVFSTFILTAACGEKLYGAAITFYENLAADTLDDVQRRQLGVVEVSPSGDISEVDPVVAADSVVTAEVPQVNGRTVHQNKCVCLLSRSPFFDTFKRFLAHVCRLSTSGPHLVPLER